MTAPATPQGSNQFQYLVESLVRGITGVEKPNPEDVRQLFTQLQSNIQAALPGGNWITPGGTKAGSSAPPSGLSFEVEGSNGSYTAKITNPTGGTATGRALWHEISYSTSKSFASTPPATVMPPTAATSVMVSAPGSQYFFRLRSSYDLMNWGPYQYATAPGAAAASGPGPVAAGKVSSSAVVEAGAFNQTNFGVVNSTAVGSSAEVSIQGANGPLTSLVRQRGPAQLSLPGATIVGIAPGTNQFVGFDKGAYFLSPTLAGVLAKDDAAPVGKVSVVSTAAPTLPVITPVVVSGYIVGYNVVSGGAGASQPYLLTLGSVGGGAGATFGAQDIENGVLISIAPGNPGNGAYSGGTTVTASGGTGGGSSGGGTAVGGNGGRLTAV